MQQAMSSWQPLYATLKDAKFNVLELQNHYKESINVAPPKNYKTVTVDTIAWQLPVEMVMCMMEYHAKASKRAERPWTILKSHTTYRNM